MAPPRSARRPAAAAAAAKKPAPVESLPEIRDREFWRRKAKTLEQTLAETEHALDQVSGLMKRPLTPPKWALPRGGARPSRAVGLLHLSDVHTGEVVRAEEVDGINAYDLEICRARLRRLFAATAKILPRWAADCRLSGVYVAVNGDLISGDIHDELARTNAITSQKQVWFVADEIAAGATVLAEAFGGVTLVFTPGNHGRSTAKTHAKRTAALNFDTMVGEALRRHFRDDSRVAVHVSPGRAAAYDILGWKVLQTHHDMGGAGGQGFAGPVLPIVRKGKATEWAAAQRRVFYDLILTAHYHTSANPGKILANGSVVGYGEFAASIMASPEPPQQWLALVHEAWGLRERCEIRLEDPKTLANPSPATRE